MSSRLEITVPPSPSSGGTVTSVDCTAPADLLSVSGVPIVGAGTIALAKVNVAANLVYCGPSSGLANLPTFRALVAADIPSLSYAPINNPIFTGSVGFTGGISLYPTVDGTSAINFTKADKVTSILRLDSTNQKVGVGIVPTSYYHQKAPITGNNPGINVFTIDTLNLNKLINVDSYGNVSFLGTFAASSGQFGPTPGSNISAINVGTTANGSRLICYSHFPNFSIILAAHDTTPTISMGGLNSASAPMLKRVLTVIQIRLSDDSDYAGLKAKTFSASSVPVFANNAAAIAGGLVVGDFYRTGADPDPVCIVH